jgi:AcrR family transcriptional regulator
MSPRPYRATTRAAAADATRARILAAARELLLEQPVFSMDAVARRADVARMTVYYQFGSRRGLVEALFDDIAARGLIPHLIPATRLEVPDESLVAYVHTFCRFWVSDRIMIRRVRALAVLDDDLEESIAGREVFRRRHARGMAERLALKHNRDERWTEEAATVIYTFTSFALFDMLADTQTPEQIEAEVLGWIKRTLGLPESDG